MEGGGNRQWEIKGGGGGVEKGKGERDGKGGGGKRGRGEEGNLTLMFFLSKNSRTSSTVHSNERFPR